MREIEFRGKGIVSNEWYYGDLIQGVKEDRSIEYYIISNHYEELQQDYGIKLNTCASPKVKPETIGQYIGLKDKNGKKIYEGDIVLYQDWTMEYEGGGNDSFINKGVIEYSESNCCFNVTERNTIDIEDVLYEDNEDLEVIGNIHDNPELLNT